MGEYNCRLTFVSGYRIPPKSTFFSNLHRIVVLRMYQADRLIAVEICLSPAQNSSQSLGRIAFPVHRGHECPASLGGASEWQPKASLRVGESKLSDKDATELFFNDLRIPRAPNARRSPTNAPSSLLETRVFL